MSCACATTPACLPAVVTTGDTVLVQEQFNCFASDAYTMALYLAPSSGGNTTNATGTGNGSTWSFAFTAPAAGSYWFGFQATQIADNTMVFTARSGQVTVIPSVTTAQAQTPSQLQLAAIDAAILAYVGSGNQSTSFNGQSFSKANIQELYDIRTRIAAAVIAEQRELAQLRGSPQSSLVGTRFVPTGGGYGGIPGFGPNGIWYPR